MVAEEAHMVLRRVASELAGEQKVELRIAALVVDLVVLDLPAPWVIDQKALLRSQATAW